jgi:broad specificity phosphatase PhoE
VEGLPRHPVRRRGSQPRGGARRRSAVGLRTPRRIVLLRHGRTAHNVDGVIQGRRDIGLDQVGRAQAEAVADVFASAHLHAVLSSNLSRALVTAQMIAARSGLLVTVDERLQEISLGGWEGLTADQARVAFPDEHAAWVAGEDIARGGGETYQQAGERAAACLLDAVASAPAGATLVAVTHGGTARGVLGTMLELPRAEWWRFSPLGNTCWSVLVEGDRGWRLERHNAGLGPLVGPAAGAHDLGSTPAGGAPTSPDIEPVK